MSNTEEQLINYIKGEIDMFTRWIKRREAQGRSVKTDVIMSKIDGKRIALLEILNYRDGLRKG